MTTINDRVAGVLIGLAMGDHNRGPVQMGLCIAESLVSQNGIYNEEDVFTRYMHWYYSRGDGWHDTGVVARRVFNLVKYNLNLQKKNNNNNNLVEFSVDKNLIHSIVNQVDQEMDHMTAGVNPSHRSVVLSMSSSISDEELFHVAQNESSLTHAHHLASEVASVIVIIARKLIRGFSFTEAIQFILEKYSSTQLSSETESALKIGLYNEEELQNYQYNGGGFSPETLADALYIMRLHSEGSPLPSSLETRKSKVATCMKSSLTLAGPANYSPVIVGAFLGAMYGATSIGNEMLNHANDNALRKCWITAETISSKW